MNQLLKLGLIAGSLALNTACSEDKSTPAADSGNTSPPESSDDGPLIGVWKHHFDFSDPSTVYLIADERISDGSNVIWFFDLADDGSTYSAVYTNEATGPRTRKQDSSADVDAPGADDTRQTTLVVDTSDPDGNVDVTYETFSGTPTLVGWPTDNSLQADAVTAGVYTGTDQDLDAVTLTLRSDLTADLVVASCNFTGNWAPAGALFRRDAALSLTGVCGDLQNEVFGPVLRITTSAGSEVILAYGAVDEEASAQIGLARLQ